MKRLLGAGCVMAVGVATLAVGTVSAAALPSKKPLLNDQFSGYPTGRTWTDGQTLGPWNVAFAGYGAVSVGPERPRAIRLAPAAATSENQTHAALVVSRRTVTKRCVNVSSRLVTRAQLRTGSNPNPWESGWLVWDYTDNDHFSYLALKTNGWELGKRDPAYPGGQRFLATGANPATAVGKWRTTRIKRVASADGTKATLHVFISGRKVARFVDTERPYRAGKIGMYTEDAIVDFDYLRATRC